MASAPDSWRVAPPCTTARTTASNHICIDACRRGAKPFEILMLQAPTTACKSPDNALTFLTIHSSFNTLLPKISSFCCATLEFQSYTSRTQARGGVWMYTASRSSAPWALAGLSLPYAESTQRAARELGPLRLRYRHAVQPCRYEGRCALERSPLRLITPALSSH